MVWLQSQPDTSDIANPKAFGSNYPLYYMNAGAGSAADRAQVSVADARRSGANGLTVNIFTKADGRLLKWIRPYLAASDHSNMLIAPLVNLATAPQGPATRTRLVVENLLDYCVEARRHRSAAKIGRSLVVFVYSANLMRGSSWVEVKAELARHDCWTFFVLNVPESVCQNRTACYKDFLGVTDYAWNFAGLTTQTFDQVSKIYWTLGKPYLGGIWPRLFSSSNGARQLPLRARPPDPGATQFYRSQWEHQLAAHPPWMTVSTLDDTSEHTNINPSSDWNTTLSDLTAWYSAKYLGSSLPFNTPQLYLTTAQALYAGQSGSVEALVLNGGAAQTTVSVQLYDSQGSAVGPPAMQRVRGRDVGAATVTVTCPSGVQSASWYTAVAMTDTGLHVRGAPILCYPAKPPSNMFVLYYSVPAARALSGDVRLSLSVSRGVVTVTLSGSNSSRPRFQDILRNTQSLGNAFTGSFTHHPVTSLPLFTRGPLIDNRNDSRDYGLYVGRVIDQNLRVGYSTPVLFADGAGR